MNKALKKCGLFLVAILIFSLTTCLNPMSGENGKSGTGKITFKLAGSGAPSVSRAMVDIAAKEYNNFNHQLTLYRENGTQEGPFDLKFDSSYTSLTAAKVPVGEYSRIVIRAYGDNPYTNSLKAPILSQIRTQIMRAIGEAEGEFTIQVCR